MFWILWFVVSPALSAIIFLKFIEPERNSVALKEIGEVLFMWAFGPITTIILLMMILVRWFAKNADKKFTWRN